MSDLAASPPRVIIAACPADADFGARLIRDLRAALGRDYAVTYADNDGPVSDARRAALEGAIRDQTAVVFVLSPEATASPWINRLIDMAWTERNSPFGKIIVPVLLRPCAVRDDLDTLQRVSFVPPRDYATAIDELVSALTAASASRPVHGDAAANGITASCAPSEHHTPPAIGKHPARPSPRVRWVLALAAMSLASVTIAALALTGTVRWMAASGYGHLAAPSPTAVRSPSATASPALVAGPTYFAPVPGPCAKNADWTFNGQPGRVTYTCLADSVLLKSYMPPSAQDSSGGIVYDWSGAGGPTMFKVSFHVAGLTAGACDETWVYYGINTLDQDYLIFVCSDGRWEAQYSDNAEASYLLGKGNVSPGGDFDLALSCEGAQVGLAIGSAFATTMTDPVPPPTAPLSGIQLSIDPSPGQNGLMRLSRFQFTPLNEAAYG